MGFQPFETDGVLASDQPEVYRSDRSMCTGLGWKVIVSFRSGCLGVPGVLTAAWATRSALAERGLWKAASSRDAINRWASSHPRSLEVDGFTLHVKVPWLVIHTCDAPSWRHNGIFPECWPVFVMKCSSFPLTCSLPRSLSPGFMTASPAFSCFPPSIFPSGSFASLTGVP